MWLELSVKFIMRNLFYQEEYLNEHSKVRNLVLTGFSPL